MARRFDWSTGPADRPVAIAVVPSQTLSGPPGLWHRLGGRSLRLMRLRVSNPALLPDLIEFLKSRVDVVAEPVSDDEVEVSLLGSYNADAMRMELYLRVRVWEAARRAAGVEVELIV